MNKVLLKIVRKVLLMPKIKQEFRKIGEFYDMYPLEALPTRDLRTANLDGLGMTPSFKVGKIVPLEERDAKALEKVAQMVLKEGMMVVEVGSWTGMSTSILAKTVVDYHGSVFAVDHWRGNEGVSASYDFAKVYDVYSIFKRNMISLGIWDIVHPLVMDSQTASQIFANGILDLVFIDADHRYEYIKKDISSWLPKLRNGGILCGHDCEGYYSEYSGEVKRIINEHLGDDYVSGIHPGVVKALHEYFQGKYSIMPNSVVWYYIKKNTDSENHL